MSAIAQATVLKFSYKKCEILFRETIQELKFMQLLNVLPKAYLEMISMG